MREAAKFSHALRVILDIDVSFSAFGQFGPNQCVDTGAGIFRAGIAGKAFQYK